MHLRLRVLASGSSGNAALVTARSNGNRHDLLIDLGVSPRAVRGHLSAEGIDFESLHGVLLTHGDTDHLHVGWARGWPSMLAPPVILRPEHGSILARAGLPNASTRWISNPLHVGPFQVRGCAVPHDTEGSTAFRIDWEGHSIGWATDLGHVPPQLLDLLEGVHVLAIESNYDRQMQMESPRPQVLKDRIMSGAGHLSNTQALEVATSLHERGTTPNQFVLLHLSQQCNSPERVRALWSDRAPHLAPSMQIACRRTPSHPIDCMAKVATLP